MNTKSISNYPLKVEWLLTRRCNLRCEYCKIVDNSSLAGEELTFEQVCMGIDNIQKVFPGIAIVFFGGEPTVLNWLPDLVRYCELRKIKYAIISNGVRVVKDEEFFNRLVSAGISNWSVSIDSLSDLRITDSAIKSKSGFKSLLKFRDKGVRDLVSCITVTDYNIKEIPAIIEELTKNGVWSITTPLQVGDGTFEYSANTPGWQCKDQSKVLELAEKLKEMALSGKYLMHNDPGYYDYWERYFIKQDWKCQSKGTLTIDADGSMKRCVDRKAGLGHLNILNLVTEEAWKKYDKLVNSEFECKGCFWDPAFEASTRQRLWDRKTAIDSFKHNLTSSQISKLLPEAQIWFKGV